MILSTAARTGVNALRTGVRLVSSLGNHALWWLDYRAGGGARRAPDDGEA